MTPEDTTRPAWKQGFADAKRSRDGGWPKSMMLRDIALSPRPNSLYNRGFREGLRDDT